MSTKVSFRGKALDSTLTLKRRLIGGRRWLAAGSTALLTFGLIPLFTASPVSAAPAQCIVTITPSVTDDSATLGQSLDDSLTAADGACSAGAIFYLGTTDDTVVYQLPKSLQWTSDDTLAIIGLGDDTPILLAADDTRVLTVEAGQRGSGPQAVDLTRLSIRGGRPITGDGGGVLMDDSTILTLRNMEFLDNHADNSGSNWGGAVRAEHGTIVAVTSRFESNFASMDAGALGALHLDIQGSEFYENSAGLYGGALENGFGGTLIVGPDAIGNPSRFIGNFTALLGGAIYRAAADSDSQISAQFERNRVTGPWDLGPAGGAIFTEIDTTEVQVTHSTFTNDSSPGVWNGEGNGWGGAIYSGAPLRVTLSTFIGSSASFRGGAIAADADVAILDSYFEGTSSRLGGAIAGGESGDGQPSEISIRNSTFWGNSADDSGSAIYVDLGVALLSVTASTLDDSAPNASSMVTAIDGATATLAGTILSKDASSAPTCEGSPDSIDDSGGNLVTSSCDSLTVVSDDSLGLLPPALNQSYPNNTGATPTIGLEPSSIAINHHTALCPSEDQRGVLRPQGASCDAGAFEAGGIESITPLATTSATVGTPYSQSLSATGFGSGTFVWDDSGTTLPPGLTLSSTGVVSGTPTTPGTYTFTARVTGPVDDSTTAQGITVSAVNPPGPAPTTPASPPQDVRAIPGIESATVSWTPPASTGSFPVTSYQAVATPGGQTCMVTAPVLTCTITGLNAGTSYTVTARALTGAGWSAASSPGATVVPLAAPEAPSILITSSRDRTQKWMARIEGTTTGLVGAEVVPYIRVAGKTSFSPGASTRKVDADGKFTWQRKAKKRLTVYFTSGAVTSNRLVIRPE